MNKLYITVATFALALNLPAQEVVTKRVTTVAPVGGGTVTIDTYRTRVREGYVTAGVPVEVVEKVLPLDVEIYNARVAGDTVKVQTLRRQQEEILTPSYTTKVRTYYKEHPYQVNIGSAMFPVWVDEATPSATTTAVNADGEIVEVPVYEQRLRQSYVSVGLPETVISQILPIDVEIYNAYASGNTAQVAVLQERRARLIPAENVSRITTYFGGHPMRVKTRENKTFTVWSTSGNGVVREVR